MHLVCRYNFVEARTYQVFPSLASSLDSSSRECRKVVNSKIAKTEQSCRKTEFKIKWSRVINLSARSRLTQVSEYGSMDVDTSLEIARTRMPVTILKLLYDLQLEIYLFIDAFHPNWRKNRSLTTRSHQSGCRCQRKARYMAIQQDLL